MAKRCPLIEICDKRVDRAFYEQYCKGSFVECKYFQEKMKDRFLPRQWLSLDVEQEV